MMHSKKSAFRNSCSSLLPSSLSGSSRKVPPTLVRGKTSLPFGTPAKPLKSNKEFGYPKRKQQADSSSSSLSLQREEMNEEERVERTSHVSTEPRKKSKPSGLRQPSPKLGFFDEVCSCIYIYIYVLFALITPHMVNPRFLLVSVSA